MVRVVSILPPDRTQSLKETSKHVRKPVVDFPIFKNFMMAVLVRKPPRLLITETQNDGRQKPKVST